LAIATFWWFLRRYSSCPVPSFTQANEHGNMKLGLADIFALLITPCWSRLRVELVYMPHLRCRRVATQGGDVDDQRKWLN
jgi:hypothetical protein